MAGGEGEEWECRLGDADAVADEEGGGAVVKVGGGVDGVCGDERVGAEACGGAEAGDGEGGEDWWLVSEAGAEDVSGDGSDKGGLAMATGGQVEAGDGRVAGDGVEEEGDCGEGDIWVVLALFVNGRIKEGWNGDEGVEGGVGGDESGGGGSGPGVGGREGWGEVRVGEEDG